MRNPTPILRAYLGFSRVADGLYRRVQRRRLVRGKEDAARLGERFGQSALPQPAGPLIWFHAASVGESQSLLGLIRLIRAERPDLTVLVTTTTVTSATLMARDLPDGALHQYSPYDTAAAVRAFLAHWHPDLAVFTESELWPRLLTEVEAQAIPLMLINARVSEKSARGWRKWPRTVRALLSPFTRILVQEQATADLMGAVGVDMRRVAVTGSLKEDLPPLEADADALAAMRAALNGRECWLAASTHAGEEEAVAKAHELACPEGEKLLILAPRHPERGAAIAEMLQGQGWRVALRSTGTLPGADTQIYIADTLGEMGLWYRLAPTAFIGGSLANVGGHNPYEPALLDCAVIHGPHVFNFAEVHDRLQSVNGAMQVSDAEGVARALTALDDPSRHSAQTLAARQELARGQGTQARVWSEIAALLG